MNKDTRKKLIACLLVNSEASTPEELEKSFKLLEQSSDDNLILSKDLIQLIYKKELVEFDTCFKLIDFPSKKHFDDFVDDMSHRIKKSRRSILKNGKYP